MPSVPDFTALPVANITEQTNSRTGYTVTVSSANAGTLVNPTAGASTPTIAPVAKASRMNSESRMDMRRVVPDPG